MQLMHLFLTTLLAIQACQIEADVIYWTTWTQKYPATISYDTTSTTWYNWMYTMFQGSQGGNIDWSTFLASPAGQSWNAFISSLSQGPSGAGLKWSSTLPQNQVQSQWHNFFTQQFQGGYPPGWATSGVSAGEAWFQYLSAFFGIGSGTGRGWPDFPAGLDNDHWMLWLNALWQGPSGTGPKLPLNQVNGWVNYYYQQPQVQPAPPPPQPQVQPPPPPPAPKPQAPAKDECPNAPKLTRIGKHGYYFDNKKRSCKAMREFCESLGSTLPIFKEPGEMQEFLDYMKTTGAPKGTLGKFDYGLKSKDKHRKKCTNAACSNILIWPDQTDFQYESWMANEYSLDMTKFIDRPCTYFDIAKKQIEPSFCVSGSRYFKKTFCYISDCGA